MKIEKPGTKSKHACPWCGAVLPNILLGEHIRNWHDAKYKGQNKMTTEQQIVFKASHYKYESNDPIAIVEKKAAEDLVNKIKAMRADVEKADELARKWNELHGGDV
jgi:hypothetical protein